MQAAMCLLDDEEDKGVVPLNETLRSQHAESTTPKQDALYMKH